MCLKDKDRLVLEYTDGCRCARPPTRNVARLRARQSASGRARDPRTVTLLAEQNQVLKYLRCKGAAKA